MSRNRQGDLLIVLLFLGFVTGTILVALVIFRILPFYWWGLPSLALTACSGIGFAWLMGPSDQDN